MFMKKKKKKDEKIRNSYSDPHHFEIHAMSDMYASTQKL